MYALFQTKNRPRDRHFEYLEDSGIGIYIFIIYIHVELVLQKNIQILKSCWVPAENLHSKNSLVKMVTLRLHQVGYVSCLCETLLPPIFIP